MTRDAAGLHEAVTRCESGKRYRYRFQDGRTMPDPASRSQDGDVYGWSCVVDPEAFCWKYIDWLGLPWQQTVIYEIHTGLAGGFDGVRSKLPELAQLGITAVQLMPIADFSGRRNWGYDGVLLYAPDESYGSPDQLRRLIDTAHGLGVQVFLDVVYNHFGPEGNTLHTHVPQFFRNDVQTPWGPAIDLRQPAVRAFLTENALYWLQEYRFDGLRLDAVHAVSDSGWLVDMAHAVRSRFSAGRHIHLIVENDNNDAHLLEQDFDAQWNDDAHHVIHHILTGETDGYYAAYTDNPTRKLLRALTEGFVYQGEPCITRRGSARGMPSGNLPLTAFVFFLQNHDQTGNRAFGERLSTLCAQRPEALQAAVTLQLLAPHIPMIFMGEERGAHNPFLYFTDFLDPALIQSVREGRRREFRQFSGYDSDKEEALPDPNAETTWECSNPYFEPPKEDTYQYYVKLLRLRHQFVSPFLAGARVEEGSVLGESAVAVRWRLNNGTTLAVYCNLSETDYVLSPGAVSSRERCVFASRCNTDVMWQQGRLSAATTVVTLTDSNTPINERQGAS